MQYMYCALIAAVIATAVAVDMAAVKAAVEACGKTFKETDRCYKNCVYTHLGVFDSEGQYVQSAAAEFVWSLFPGLTQQQVTEVTTTCGSALDKSAAGCERAHAVDECWEAELKKMIGKKYDATHDHVLAMLKNA